MGEDKEGETLRGGVLGNGWGDRSSSRPVGDISWESSSSDSGEHDPKTELLPKAERLVTRSSARVFPAGERVCFVSGEIRRGKNVKKTSATPTKKIEREINNRKKKVKRGSK